MQTCWRNDWKTWVRCRRPLKPHAKQRKNASSSGKDCKNARGKVYKESVWMSTGERKVENLFKQMSVERSFSTDSQRYWHWKIWMAMGPWDENAAWGPQRWMILFFLADVDATEKLCQLHHWYKTFSKTFRKKNAIVPWFIIWPRVKNLTKLATLESQLCLVKLTISDLSFDPKLWSFENSTSMSDHRPWSVEKPLKINGWNQIMELWWIDHEFLSFYGRWL